MNQFGTSANNEFFYYIINKNNDHLISVTFSDFDEYIPDLSFEKMFYNRKELISVDFSKISLYLNIELTNIFYGCENLAYVNFNMKKSYFIVTVLEQMFYNGEQSIEKNSSYLKPKENSKIKIDPSKKSIIEYHHSIRNKKSPKSNL